MPDYVATTPFARGIERCVARFDADPSRQPIVETADAQWDQLIEVYQRGLAAARAVFDL